MKKKVNKYLYLTLGFLFILSAYPVAKLLSTEIISSSDIGHTYWVDTDLVFYLTVSFWIVGIVLCLFVRQK